MEIEQGAVIEQPGSSLKNKVSSWRTKRPIIQKDRCKGCGTCWQVCPDGAIKSTKTGFKINYDYCKGCLICATECPYGAIKVVDER